MNATQTITQENILSNEYFTTVALAKELNVSTRTLERWHVLRVGPPRTAIGRTILYRRESVLEWLRAREEKNRRRTH